MKNLCKIFMLIGIIFSGISCFIVYNNPTVEDLSINYTSYELYEHQSVDLEVYMNPSICDYKKHVYWNSSNENIATVFDGFVQAKKIGECVISAKVDDKEVQCTISVKPRVVENIGITSKYSVISIGESMYMYAQVIPTNATNKNVTWSSSNENILKISENGEVKGISEGIATVTATAHNGVSSTAFIEVKEDILPESVEIQVGTNKIKRNNSTYVRCIFYPENTTVKDVVFTSSNEEIATIKNNNIYGEKAGTVTISAKTVNNIVVSCQITVEEIKAESIFANEGMKLIGMTIGDSVYLTLKIFPFNSTDTRDDVVFESKNTSVATVTKDGLVTAVGSGQTYIFFKIDDKLVGSALVSVN